MQLADRIRTYYKFTLWVILIGYLCLAPADEFKKVHITIPYFDKVVHFGLFLILGMLIGAKREFRLAVTIYFWQVFFSVIYGGLIELAQNYFTTSRKGDWMDWVADLVGLFFGIYVIRILPAKVIRILT
jgi:VanZ family protein